MDAFFQDWGLLVLAVVAMSCVLGRWVMERAAHIALVRAIPTRIHVNGVRGKSTATRYIAAVLREAGVETIAKTTGSATRVIDETGEEHPIERVGAPTIIEQISVLRRHAKPSTEAIVFECMALRPEYQRVSERQIIHSTVGVVLNVRRDHIEQLGETLPEIAVSLSNTMPPGRPCYTAEQVQADVLRKQAERAGTVLHVVDPESVSAEDMEGLGPFSFRANVAVALAVAEELGIGRDVALKGIRQALDDPGASKVFEHEIAGKKVFWVDLFGINDPQSVSDNVTRFLDWLDEDAAVVAVLNNRQDRQNRAREFQDFLAEDMSFDRVMLLGAFRDVVADELKDSGVDAERIFIVEDDADIDAAIEEVVAALDKECVVLFGMANIHTDAADRFRKRLERED